MQGARPLQNERRFFLNLLPVRVFRVFRGFNCGI
jgi:hypothetical protein